MSVGTKPKSSRLARSRTRSACRRSDPDDLRLSIDPADVKVDRAVKENPFYRDLTALMQDPLVRKHIVGNLGDALDLKAVLMFMSLYDTIERLGQGRLSGDQVTTLVHQLFNDTDARGTIIRHYAQSLAPLREPRAEECVSWDAKGARKNRENRHRLHGADSQSREDDPAPKMNAAVDASENGRQAD